MLKSPPPKSRHTCKTKNDLRLIYPTKLIHYLCIEFNLVIGMEGINRQKSVLVEKEKTGKWLTEQLEKDSSTASKWCTNV